MIKAIIGIGVVLVWITFFALAKAAGMADRRLEEIQRLSAEREAGGICGDLHKSALISEAENCCDGRDKTGKRFEKLYAMRIFSW